MKKLLALLIISITFLFASPQPANAQLFKDWSKNCIVNNVPTLRCLPDVFSNLINAGIAFVGVVALILIIYSGIRLVTSGGDPKKVGAARAIMTYAIIGMVIVLCSFAIVSFIGYVTKSGDCIGNLGNIATGGCK